MMQYTRIAYDGSLSIESDAYSASLSIESDEPNALLSIERDEQCNPLLN